MFACGLTNDHLVDVLVFCTMVHIEGSPAILTDRYLQLVSSSIIMPLPIVYINSWPTVDKYAIARALATRLGPTAEVVSLVGVCESRD